VLARRRRSDTGSIGELFGGLRPPIYQGDQNARAGLVNKERTYTTRSGSAVLSGALCMFIPSLSAFATFGPKREHYSWSTLQRR
jgi:hypothetical protein